MPKITEATVAEHRRMQHEQVLRAARELITEKGSIPSVGQVARRVGLARTSVYQYVQSRDDLVAQLLVHGFEEWAASVRSAMEAGGASPRERLMAYVDSNLELFTDWSRNSMLAAAAREPGAMRTPEVTKAHSQLQPDLVQALVEAGLSEPEARPYAELLDVAIHHGADMIVRGSDHADVREALARMVNAALATG